MPSMPAGSGRSSSASASQTADVPSAPTSVPGATAPIAGSTTCESMTATATVAGPSMPVRSRHASVSDPAAEPIGSGSASRAPRPSTTPSG